MNEAAEVLPAAAAYDRTTQDIGNIVEFGHLNVRVPDQRLAILFYVTGLGLTRDPYLITGVDNAWINVGTCQFHLPVGPAQVLRGRVGLVLPDLDALTCRLALVAPRLADTGFAFTPGDGMIEVTCPWGNQLRVHAPDAARFGRIVLGMPYVEVDVAPGALEGIARFYRTFLAAPADLGEDARGAFARVATGLNGSLIFRQTARELPAYDGHHVQVSVADFSGVHRRLLERGLVTEESDASQYRFQDIVDPDGGRVLHVLEHEVRSMRHPMYARRLVNREPSVTNRAFSGGHEAAAWQMPPS
jgi:catechol 2,3-dioxygenase-like lactoylglutathione lyase family enzyme